MKLNNTYKGKTHNMYYANSQIMDNQKIIIKIKGVEYVEAEWIMKNSNISKGCSNPTNLAKQKFAGKFIYG